MKFYARAATNWSAVVRLHIPFVMQSVTAVELQRWPRKNDREAQKFPYLMPCLEENGRNIEMNVYITNILLSVSTLMQSGMASRQGLTCTWSYRSWSCLALPTSSGAADSWPCTTRSIGTVVGGSSSEKRAKPSSFCWVFF